MENVKKIIAQNLANLRKEENLTQGALAKKFGYSDKAVSKWECGDSMPDIEVLVTLAEFYHVSLDYLINENPSNRDKEENKNADILLFRNRIILTFIVVVAVFLVATLVFVYENLIDTSLFSWRAFLWAIPLSSFIMLIFMRRWKINNLITIITRSILLWSLLTCVYLQIAIYTFWYVFLLGIPIQILIILSHLFRTTKV